MDKASGFGRAVAFIPMSVCCGLLQVEDGRIETVKIEMMQQSDEP